MATGHRMRYETLGPDSWVLTSFWRDHRRLLKTRTLRRHEEIADTENATTTKLKDKEVVFFQSQALISWPLWLFISALPPDTLGLVTVTELNLILIKTFHLYMCHQSP